VHAEGERVILTRGEGRQEIDLVPPPAAASEAAAALPEPVCPQGVPTANAELGCEEPPAPGVSALDAGLARLGETSAEPEGGDA